ncbi:hypothetical protein Tco_0850649 [Tanacetum coccineum]
MLKNNMIEDFSSNSKVHCCGREFSEVLTVMDQKSFVEWRKWRPELNQLGVLPIVGFKDVPALLCDLAEGITPRF